MLLHLLVIVLFVMYELPLALTTGTKSTFLKFIVFYIFNILFFYFCRYFLLPRIANMDWKWNWSVLLLLALIVYTFLSLIIGQTFIKLSNSALTVFTMAIISYTFWRGVYVLGLSFLFYFLSRSVLKEKERSQMELAYLRAQVNPHLVFNTLNYTYSKIIDISPDAAKSIELLSDFMRNALASTRENDTATIESEIEQIKRYIELNQLLYNNTLQLVFSNEVKEDWEQLKIPSHLLVNLVENMFKHGNLIAPEEPASIYLFVDQYMLQFTTENEKHEYKKVISQNIGLKNCRDRLLLAYKNNFNLNIIETNKIYKLELTIKI